MKKRVLIVGAGIAGLSAGWYARQAGYETEIFESHSLPGGLCTAWKRKGYTFDISMHMLAGAVSGPFYQMWKELGVIDGFDLYSHDHICAVEALNQKVLLTTDRRDMESRLTSISPADAGKIREFTALIFGRDLMGAASLSPNELMSFRDKLGMLKAVLPAMRTMSRYGNRTLQELTAEFSHPFLKEAVRYILDAPGWPMVDFPASYMMGIINAGVTRAPAPLGGSFKVMQLMARRFQESGGIIHYDTRVSGLSIDDDRVTGLDTDNGDHYSGDEIIWAGDGHTLIYGLLDGQYTDSRIDDMYQDWIAVKPILHVMMGVNMDFSGKPHRTIFQPRTSVSVGERDFDRLCMIHHSFDPSMAPPGKSAVEVWYDTDFDYWKKLSGDRTAYTAEKNRIAEDTIEQLDIRWPGFKKAVEVVDVPTPVTYERYTGNWKGSPDGWYVTPGNARQMEAVRDLPGLDGLQMIGQWTAPFAGTVTSALTGRQAVQLLCHREKRQFRTGE